MWQVLSHGLVSKLTFLGSYGLSYHLKLQVPGQPFTNFNLSVPLAAYHLLHCLTLWQLVSVRLISTMFCCGKADRMLTIWAQMAWRLL